MGEFFFDFFHFALKRSDHCSPIPQGKTNRCRYDGGKGAENAECELKQAVELGIDSIKLFLDSIKLFLDSIKLFLDSIKLGIHIGTELGNCLRIGLDFGHWCHLRTRVAGRWS